MLQDRVTMRPLGDALEDVARVVSMDLRGHGGSSAIHGVALAISDLVTDVVAVLDAAEVREPVYVVGVGLGAVIAQGMETSHPDRVAGTVIVNFPTDAMLDAATLKDIANRAYREQTEQALNKLLDLNWGEDWKDSVPKARAAAARRSAGAIHPVLTALSHEQIEPAESLLLPGGTPFGEDEDVERVVAAISRLIAGN